MLEKYFRNRFALPVLAAASFSIPLLLEVALRGPFFDETGRFVLIGVLLYWVVPLALAACAVAGLRHLRSSPAAALPWRAVVAGAALATALSWLAGATYAPRARVQWDESDLLSASLSMHFRHSALGPAMSVPVPGGSMPVSMGLSRRPPFYPFAVSVAHALLSPSAENPFRVNRALLWAFLLLLFLAASRAADPATGAAACLLASSSPLLFWVATSGGMDFAALFLVTAAALAALACLRAPSGDSFAMPVTVGILASYARYETVAVAVVLVAACFLRARRHGVPFAVLARPLLLVPPLLFPLSLLLRGPSQEFVSAGAGPAFSARFFAPNAASLLAGFFGPHLVPYCGPLSCLGLAVFVFVLSRRHPRADLLLLAACASLPALPALFFFAGGATRMESARLYLVPSTALALAPLLLRTSLLPRRAAGLGLFAGAAGLLACTWAVMRGGDLYPLSQDALVGEAVTEFARERGAASVLYVMDPPLPLVTAGHTAVSSAYLVSNEASWRPRLRAGNIEHAFWIRTGTEYPFPEAELAREKIAKGYALREIRRLRLGPLPTVFYEILPR
jgi:hypothetical protein